MRDSRVKGPHPRVTFFLAIEQHRTAKQNGAVPKLKISRSPKNGVTAVQKRARKHATEHEQNVADKRTVPHFPSVQKDAPMAWVGISPSPPKLGRLFDSYPRLL